eukprot:TRINITY_DN79_c0_g1_i3.p1 TRINITY_DN79_c0_g1~~TRINITY_DN79_c0_g1_i3.p1  ORF type:complete len:353 (+),score=94.86 TRINITY_DN79_c0_g1_i3:71-1129(+)
MAQYRLGTANIFDSLNDDEENDPDQTVQAATAEAVKARQVAIKEKQAAEAREKSAGAAKPQQAATQAKPQAAKSDARGPRGEKRDFPRRQQRDGDATADAAGKEQRPRRDNKPKTEGGERRPKRDHDKHVSGTGRRDTEKRSGSGKANWGAATDVAPEVAGAKDAAAEVDDAAAAAPAGDDAPKEDEGPKEISLSEFLKQQAATRAQVSRPAERQANDGKAVEGFALAKNPKVDEPKTFARGKAAPAPAKETVPFKFVFAEDQRADRGRRDDKPREFRGDRDGKPREPRDREQRGGDREQRGGDREGKPFKPRDGPKPQRDAPKPQQQRAPAASGARGLPDLKSEDLFPSLK